MTEAQALNLQRICEEIERHDRYCRFGGRAVAVAMSPFEVDRLGWDEVKGLPIVPDSDLGTGRARIICSAQEDHDQEGEQETTDAPLEVVT